VEIGQRDNVGMRYSLVCFDFVVEQISRLLLDERIKIRLDV